MLSPAGKFLLVLAAGFAVSPPLSGQVVVNSTFIDGGTSTTAYSEPSNWSPAEVPNNTATRHYNVLIPERMWVLNTDTDATVSNLTLGGFLSIYDRSFVVTETTALEPPGSTGILVEGNAAPASFNAGTLTAFSGGTLRGYYLVAGWTHIGTLQFDGADVSVLGDGSSLLLYGPSARIIDENGNDGLRNLARVQSSAHLTLAGKNLTTSAPFTNVGEIVLGHYFDVSILEAAVSLGNFDSASRTISGGIFQIGFSDFYGQSSALAEFRFAGADVVNNGSDIRLEGPLSRMADLTGNDGLRNLARNLVTGSLTFRDHDFTTIGSFNNEGSLVLSRSAFTIAGSLDNFDPGSGTLSGGIYSIGKDAVLKFGGADIRRNAASITLQRGHITDLTGNDALRNFRDNLAEGSFTVGNTHLFTASGDFTNAGRVETAQAQFGIYDPDLGSGEFRLPADSTYTQTTGATINGGIFTADNINILGGSFSGSGSIKGNLSVTNATVAPGGNIDGNLTLGPETRVHLVSSYNYTEGWGTVTGAASLDGTLEVELAAETSLSSDKIIRLLYDAGSVSGTFSNAPHGARINAVDGSWSFVVLYGPNSVTLADFHALPPPAQLLNISTRAFLSREDDDPYGSRRVLIGGFIISGAESKKVVVRGLGPSLGKAGLSPTLADPTMELHGSGATIATNDDWADSQGSEMIANGLAPDDPREAAIIATLDPGMYTVVIREKNGLGGHGLVEVYDIASSSNSKLANISTRGFTDDANVLIGGIIADEGQANAELVVRAIGPILRRNGIFNALEDPTLEVRNANGGVLAFNDDWFTNYERIPSELQPHDSRESAIRLSLPRGNYTALVRAKANSGGVALVEFYDLRR